MTLKRWIALILAAILILSLAVMGLSAQADALTPTVTAITVQPVYLLENTGGYRFQDWNPETEEFDGEYYHYDWMADGCLQGQLTLSDGTSRYFRGAGFTYGGVTYSLSCTDNQSFVSPWLAGGRYSATVSFGDVKTTLTVYILKQGEENGFSYTVCDGAATVTGCALEQDTLTVPDTLGGFPVCAIRSLGDGLLFAETLILPDSVTTLEETAFLSQDPQSSLALRQLQLGKGISSLSSWQLEQATRLESVTLSSENPHLTAIDGILYNKAADTLLLYPRGRSGVYTVPDSVTDVSAFFADRSLYPKATIALHPGVAGYVQADGVIYNEAMTRLLLCSPEKTGSFTLPETVTSVAPCAFAYTVLDKVDLGSRLTVIPYGCFYGSKLQQLHLPQTLTQLQPQAFAGASLAQVHIADLESWCNADILGQEANPLHTGATLYTGAQPVSHLTIPATVTKIKSYAFYGGSFTALTLPEGLVSIGTEAFAASAVQRITLPDSLDHLAPGVFSDCSQLVYADLGGGLDGIAEATFQNSGLQTLVLGENITLSCANAFSGCSRLANVFYAGKQALWAEATVHAGNQPLQDAVWHWESQALTGDLDGDGQVSDSDAIYLLWHALFPDDFPINQTGDVNADGTVSDADAIYLLWHTLFPDTYPL